MKTFLLFGLLCTIGLFTLSSHTAEKLYKVIDQNGKISYQDRPPIDDKSTVLEKTFESRSNSVRPDNSSANDRDKPGEPKQQKKIGQNDDADNKTTKSLSPEELTAIANGNSTDDDAKEFTNDKDNDDKNDSLPIPNEPAQY